MRQDQTSLLQKLHFTTEDIFDNVESIAVYQFESYKGTATIHQLAMTDYGFEIPSFNNTLEKLIMETAQIQQVGESEL